jgi:hypothetical protein
LGHTEVQSFVNSMQGPLNGSRTARIPTFYGSSLSTMRFSSDIALIKSVIKYAQEALTNLENGNQDDQGTLHILDSVCPFTVLYNVRSLIVPTLMKITPSRAATRTSDRKSFLWKCTSPGLILARLPRISCRNRLETLRSCCFLT